MDETTAYRRSRHPTAIPPRVPRANRRDGAGREARFGADTDYGLSDATVYRWIDQDRIDHGELPGTTSAENAAAHRSAHGHKVWPRMQVNLADAFKDAGPEHPIELRRRKDREPVIALAYRLYRLLRPIVPRRALARLLLRLAWIFDRISMEQVLYWQGPERGYPAVRPHSRILLDQLRPLGSNVMEMGCGEGVFTPILARNHASVIAADLDRDAIAKAQERCRGLSNVELLVGDGIAVAASRGPFDIAVLLHVLEHLDDPVARLRELACHCEHLVVELPDIEAMPMLSIRRAQHIPFYWDDDHVREFSIHSLRSTLEAGGWRVDSITRVNACLLAVGSSLAF